MNKETMVLSDKGKECRDMLGFLRSYDADEDLQKAALVEYWFPGTLGGSFHAVACKEFLGNISQYLQELRRDGRKRNAL